MGKPTNSPVKSMLTLRIWDDPFHINRTPKYKSSLPKSLQPKYKRLNFNYSTEELHNYIKNVT